MMLRSSAAIFVVFISTTFVVDAACSQSPAEDKSDHWAFRPPREPSLPQVSNTSWPRTPVDRFVLSELENAGLSPAPAADRRTLIRRATFDLIGLPPTPEEVDAFVTDDSADALAKVVDRLLASPHYAERWGRHWLDVARYADSNGLDENVAHAHAWRYRDWAIDAFNDDMPYDQFVREQLAGDLLPSDDPLVSNRRLIATGFLSLGPKVLAEVDEQKMEMDIVDEQIDTVGKAFLGLTLGCARCHDHKFDPITMQDYYALAGIFKSTRTMDSFTKIARWHENTLTSEDYRLSLKAHERNLADKKSTLERVIDHATAALRNQPGQEQSLPEKLEESFSRDDRDKLERLRDEIATLEKSKPRPPMAMGVCDGTPGDAAVQQRGDPWTIGERVPRGVPSVLRRGMSVSVGTKHSGRLELAEWLTHPNHPLTARVMVNRIWRWHFGRGLVETTDNFGQRGERPSNARLLDWLAVQLIKSDWSIKRMHRLIMRSAVYSMSSRHDLRAARTDPRNRLLWRWTPRRLEAEEIRDALLAVSGQLDETQGGSLLVTENRMHIFDHTSKDETNYDSRRRSVYLPIVRNHLVDVLTLFDYTDASVPNGDRNTSTVASQALYLMNSDIMADVSRRLADKVVAASGKNEKGCIDALYTIVYGRPACDDELERAVAFLRRFDAELANADEAVPNAGPRQRESWRLLCHTLLIANEFFYVR